MAVDDVLVRFELWPAHAPEFLTVLIGGPSARRLIVRGLSKGVRMEREFNGIAEVAWQ